MGEGTVGAPVRPHPGGRGIAGAATFAGARTRLPTKNPILLSNKELGLQS
jgi:hypothetical protein